MKFISHRGNINGKNFYMENNPDYINKALNLGYDVEIDIWYNNGFWLGHDNSQYPIDYKFLLNSHLWCHAKNYDAIIQLKQIKAHYFWHENDKYTLTSHNIIWSYPGSKLYPDCVCVLPEINQLSPIINCYGICSDFIIKYKNEYSNTI